MTKQEMQEKLDFIVRSHDTIMRSSGYKEATDIKIAYFFDLVRMVQELLEKDNGQRKTDIREEWDQWTGESGGQ